MSLIAATRDGSASVSRRLGRGGGGPGRCGGLGGLGRLGGEGRVVVVVALVGGGRPVVGGGRRRSRSRGLGLPFGPRLGTWLGLTRLKTSPHLRCSDEKK